MTLPSNATTVTVRNVALPLDYAQKPGDEPLRLAVSRKLRIPARAVLEARLLKRSVDARHKDDVRFVATMEAHVDADALRAAHLSGDVAVAELTGDGDNARFAGSAEAASAMPQKPQRAGGWDVPPMVCGMGPAGLFAALELARAGACPVCVERGGNVDQRRAMVDAFKAGGPLDVNTNIQFGEGGAGTFSDGKLSTGTKSPVAARILRDFVDAGAPEEILWQGKPHIGTDLLPGVVRELRQRVEQLGGKVLFNTRLTGLVVEDGRLAGVMLCDADGERQLPCGSLVLACGHSARDTFQMLHSSGVMLERKSFSLGVRVEHAQAAVDRAQYGKAAGHPALGAADYHLSCHLRDGRGVYSFCMCPGGEVVPAASEQGGVVTNGMSNFARDGRNANAGFLVDVRPSDLPGTSPLAGMAFQREWESAAFELGGGDFRAPAQLMGDFLAGKPTSESNGTAGKVRPTYARGVTWGSLDDCLPQFVADSLRQAVPLFNRKLHCFADPAAVLTGVETRSSSPVRITRDSQTLEASGIAGLYPCGEGAGYAGGIMSAAQDGMRVAQVLIDGSAG